MKFSKVKHQVLHLGRSNSLQLQAGGGVAQELFGRKELGGASSVPR